MRRRSNSEGTPRDQFPSIVTGHDVPVFPYPEQTQYTGQGSIDDASNYVGVMPLPLPDDDYNWVGNDLFDNHEGDH